jgi:hypothetical protein
VQGCQTKLLMCWRRLRAEWKLYLEVIILSLFLTLFLLSILSNEEKELEVISTVLAKERAQPLLTETRARIEREKQEEINKNKLMIVPVKGQENKDVEIERACASVIEGELESSSHDDLGEIKAPRVTV